MGGGGGGGDNTEIFSVQSPIHTISALLGYKLVPWVPCRSDVENKSRLIVIYLLTARPQSNQFLPTLIKCTVCTA